MEYQSAFRTALEADLASNEMSEAELGRRLGVSQQAVNKWVQRGFPPLSRVHMLRDIPHSARELAELFDMIPESNRVARAQAYAEASKAILNILGQPVKPLLGYDKE